MHAAMRIHVSPRAKEALSKFAGYSLADRGLVNVKVLLQLHGQYLKARRSNFSYDLYFFKLCVSTEHGEDQIQREPHEEFCDVVCQLKNLTTGTENNLYRIKVVYNAILNRQVCEACTCTLRGNSAAAHIAVL